MVRVRNIEIEQYNQFRLNLAQDRELLDVWNKGKGLAKAELTDLERLEFDELCTSYIWIGVGTYERSVILNRQGTIRGAIRSQASWIRQNPGYRDFWESTKDAISRYELDDYVSAVDGELTNN